VECVLCGKETKELVKVEVEGAEIEVCKNCALTGKFKIKEEGKVYQPIKRNIVLPVSEDFEFVENYGEKIKKAREAKGLSRKEFAKIIGEKESVIKRIEEERAMPYEKLREKIEKFLGIKLLEKYEEKVGKKAKTENKLTIGDVVEIK
jgi:putative transcription factor